MPKDQPIITNDYRFRVLYGDTDQMGIVYHVNYFKYMEAGRVELLRQGGWSYAAMENRGIRIPVLSAHADYHAPALYDEQLRVHTILEKLNRVRLEFRYEIWCDERETKLVSGVTTHAFTDASNKVKRVDQAVLDRILGR